MSTTKAKARNTKERARVAKKRPPRSRAESKAETRRALIQAGVEAFAEEGLDGPSLDSICERAGKTRGAFYVHFADRDELLAAVMEHVLGNFANAVIAGGGSGSGLEDTVQAFVRVARAPQGLPGSRVPMYQFLTACARTPELRTRFQRFLTLTSGRLVAVAEQAQTRGGVRKDVRAAAFGPLLVALVTGLYVLREQRVPMDLDTLSGDLLRLLAPEARDG